MSEIKTGVNAPEAVIYTQNKVVRNYALQLKSAVVTTEHKKALLREIQLELTAQQQLCSEHCSPIRKVIKSATTQSEVSSGNQLQTERLITVPSVLTYVDSDYIKTQRSSDYIKTAKITYSDNVKVIMAASENLDEKMMEADKLWRKKVVSRAMSLKHRQLKNQKYTIASADSDGSEAIETAQMVQGTGSAVLQAGGMLRTAVNNTAKGVESIKTTVKHGIKVGSIKNIGNIATAVKSGVANVVKDTGNQLIKTKIDKSKITDTGTETIKEGLTDIRYADNTRKAVLNTARSTVKAGYAVKNMPRETRSQVNRIKNNAKKAREAAKKTADVVKKY